MLGTACMLGLLMANLEYGTIHNWTSETAIMVKECQE